MDTLGKRLRAARDEKGLSLKDLAAACGAKTSQAVWKWEKDVATPSPHDVWTLAEMLDVHLKWLITGLGPRHSRGDDEYRAIELRGRTVPSVPFDDVSAYLSGHTYVPSSEVRTTQTCGPRSFATTMPDRSNEPHIPKGATVIVDPDLAPEPGNFVMAIIDGAVSIRRYRPRQDHVELAPADDNWPPVTVPLDHEKWLIGTASEVARTLLA